LPINPINDSMLFVVGRKENSKATDLLMESVERLNMTQSPDFRKNASSVIAAMLESRLGKQQQPKQPPQKPFVAKKFDPEFLPPPPPKFTPMNGVINEFTSCDQDLPLPPPPSPLKIPASILTPPLSSDENDLPQKPIDNVNVVAEKVNYRNKRNQPNGHNNQSSDAQNAPSRFSINKPELSTHARDRRSYIEKNNNETAMNGATATTVVVVAEDDEADISKIADGLANGQHPVCDKCKCKITR
jgi:hypothetical protein